MKKLIFSFLALILVTVTLIPSQGEAQESLNLGDSESFTGSIEEFNEIKKALESTELTIDMENEKNIEETIFDENGEEVGTLGIEEVSSVPAYDIQDGEIGTFTTIPKGVNKTYKVYWYAATVNYHFYVTVYVNSSTGLGHIVSTRDAWYMVIPPGYVSSDSVTIPRKYETSSYAAEARYTLSMSAPVSTKLWIYGKVKNGKFTTGGN